MNQFVEVYAGRHYTQSSFGDLTVTPDEVFHLINALDTNKANGPDNISAFMLIARVYCYARA